jgi:hypothetical protein
MPYDEDLAERIRRSFAERVVHFDEKRMMGGLCFMVGGKMCVGIAGERLMVFVTPAGTNASGDFESWIDRALEFNPRGKASKPRSSGAKRKLGR